MRNILHTDELDLSTHKQIVVMFKQSIDLTKFEER